VLEKSGSRLALAGIDDWNFGKPRLDRALDEARRLAPGAPVVLVSHNPDAFFDAAARGVALMLSGHTHGGQVRIPGRPVLVRMSRYRLDEGRYERSGAQLVVSRGLGVSGIPLRLFCPPEALLVTLRRPVP
jgi:predicted MPP superfamily phosphohydrolase